MMKQKRDVLKKRDEGAMDNSTQINFRDFEKCLHLNKIGKC